NGKATINGYLEDYCFVIQAFISIFEVTLNEKWLLNAKQLTDYCFEHFYDNLQQLFAFTSDLDKALISKHYEIEDNVIPASNSVMANNLFKLNLYFENGYYKQTLDKMIQNIIPTIDYPSAFSNWLNVYLNEAEQNKELIVSGENALAICNDLHRNYHPNIVVIGALKPSNLPVLKNKFIENETVFYLCQNKTCALPTTDFELIKNKINGL
ncbi:MAG: thioredoxin domain-containing protein, partial [Methylotenera sp.]|nr:thioredoxin domain-containing protein [Flavobacterium sp.]